MININRYGVSFSVTETTEYLNHFWRDLFPGWEESTYRTIIPHLHKEKTFLDIGAWQGPISMVAQHYSKQCICFEPDPIAFSNLSKNIELNNFKNIIAVNKAVSSEPSLKIGHPTELGGGGSSYLTNNLVTECNTISISEILETYKLNQGNISLVKIDIEGYECELLRDPILKQLKVPMHISMHPFMFTDKKTYFDKMSDFFGSYSYIDYNVDTYEIYIDKRL
jgi:FkbM family methyltransferase